MVSDRTGYGPPAVPGWENGPASPINLKPSPPHNYEAEQALLGAMMCNNAVYHRVSGFLKPDHFADALHARIFEAMAKLISRGQLANPVTLKRQFDQDGALQDIGGAQYLVQLASAVVTILNAEDYGHAIRDLFVRRQLMGVAEDLFLAVQHDDPDGSPLKIISGFERRLEAIALQPGIVPTDANVQSFREVLQEVIEQADKALKGEAIQGVMTGLTEVDGLLNGLLPGDMFVLAGRPGMGKTALALTMSKFIAGEGKHVGIESIEMTSKQLGTRALTGPAGVSSIRLRRGEITQEEFDNLDNMRRQIDGLPIRIASSSAPTMEELAARWRAEKVRFGLDVLIVDYLQLVRGHDDAEAKGRYEVVTSVSRGHKALAKDLGIPVIALCQLSRQVEMRENKRPTLSDLKESGSIEQDADQCAFLYRHEYYLNQQEPERKANEKDVDFEDRKQKWLDSCRDCAGKAEIIVAKNRHGGTGTAKLMFDAQLQKFHDIPRHDEPPTPHPDAYGASRADIQG